MPITDKIQDKLVKALEYHKLQNLAQAEILYKEVLEAAPDSDIALQFLGTLLLQTGKYSEALECYLKALAFDAQNPELNYKAGFLFHQFGNLTKAIEHYNLVLQYIPDHADTYYKLGLILHDNNQPEQAVNFYKKAIELNLINDEIYNNLGTALYLLNRIDEALEYYKKALDINPNNFSLYNRLGSAYQSKNDFQNAINYYYKAIEVNPEPFNYYSLSKALLVTENFEKGWEYFESRIDTFDWHKLRFNPQIIPKWTGQSLKDKKICIYYTGGNGDSILFARYIPVLSSMGAKVVCAPQNSLIELFEQSDLKAEIISPDNLSVDTEFDYQLPLFSCGNSFEITPENIPYKESFLKTNPEKTKFYREKYFNNDKFKIGLCWQCTNQPFDLRSIPLNYFYKLKNIENVELYSLQKDYGSEQINTMPEDFKITSLGETFENFADTAAAIENLDLVITIDTVIVHLAGALGKKTWILIPFAPDWRWLLDRDDCIWYNSVNIMRQKEFGNWAELSDRLFDKLRDYTNNIL